jgi:hypothetical protein
METNHPSPAASAGSRDSTLTEAKSPLDAAALAAALAGIRADSLRDPEIYLQDTVVPSGGE